MLAKWLSVEIEVSVESIPFPVNIGYQLAHVESMYGSIGSRFRPGSQFVIREFRICESSGSKIVRIRFSEPIRLPIDTTFINVVNADGGKVQCQSIPAPNDSSALATEISIACKALELPSAMRINGNLQSIGGNVLTDLMGKAGSQSYLLPFDSRNTDSSGCSIYYHDEIIKP